MIAVRCEDGVEHHVFLRLRDYVADMSLQRWPHTSTGRRGRPYGGGMKQLASAMGITGSALSLMLTRAESQGRITARAATRLADAFEMSLANFREGNEKWFEKKTRGGSDVG